MEMGGGDVDVELVAQVTTAAVLQPTYGTGVARKFRAMPILMKCDNTIQLGRE